MKRKKLISSLLLIGILISNSCAENRDSSKDIEFSSEVIFPEEVVSGKNQILRIKLSSEVYKDGVLEHVATFTDDKESFLISPDGKKITSGEKFSITNVDKYVDFNFYSESVGIHNLTFTFTNSKGFSVTKKIAVMVGKGFFEVAFKSPNGSVKINTPVEIEYDFAYTSQELTDYELKFEVESTNDTRLDATLNGHKSGEWFSISGHKGKLYYTPINSGSHTVHVTVKNKLNIERVSSFLVVTHGNPVITYYETNDTSFVLQLKDNMGFKSNYLLYSYLPIPALKFSAYSGGDNLTISSISISAIVDGVQSTTDTVGKDIKSTNVNYSHKVIYAYGVAKSYDDDEIGKKVEVKIVIVNSAGLKTEMIIPIKVKDIKVENVEKLELPTIP